MTRTRVLHCEMKLTQPLVSIPALQQTQCGADVRRSAATQSMTGKNREFSGSPSGVPSPAIFPSSFNFMSTPHGQPCGKNHEEWQNSIRGARLMRRCNSHMLRLLRAGERRSRNDTILNHKLEEPNHVWNRRICRCAGCDTDHTQWPETARIPRI